MNILKRIKIKYKSYRRDSLESFTKEERYWALVNIPGFYWNYGSADDFVSREEWALVMEVDYSCGEWESTNYKNIRKEQ